MSREPETPALAPDGAPEMSREARQAVLRAIVADVMADPDAPSRPESVLFQDFLLRCRIKKVAGTPVKLPEFRGYLNEARAGVAPELAAGENWSRVTDIAAALPEDVQAVFMLLARAAMEQTPCPSDLEFARVCGTSSAARARSRIAHLDRQGIVVIRSDMRGARIVAIPDLGWETAAGDPNAPAAIASPGVPELAEQTG